MPPPRLLPFVGVVFLLVLAAAGYGIWSYLFGANEVDSAALVPGNTIVFASIPNAALVLEGYETSKMKTLVESPQTKSLRDMIVKWVGQKNVDLLQTLLPSLSGQSFIAVTRFDTDHPEQIGLIAAMKPKAGLGDFNAFIDKLKATWPDMVKQGKTGTSTVEGVDYDWIQGPGAPDKICVAHIRGWIVATWGEASLQDWIERFRKKSDTSSLADDLNYRKALSRVGDDPMTLLYINYHSVMEAVQKQEAKTNPALGDYLAQKLDTLGGAAVATRFENGEIVDRFTFLVPHPAQVSVGIGTDPCPFDTLKFTGPDTRFYWAAGMDWKQYYQHLREQAEPSSPYAHTTFHPMAEELLTRVQNWVHGTTLDPHQNILDALGSEISVQGEWSADAPYPEVGLFLKVDKPDDFKPTISAIIDSVRKAYATTAVINELNSNGQNFATLQFLQSSPFSPTITEGGPYLGVFLTENQAVRSFQRGAGTGLAQNADFSRQVGDKLKTATQVIFLDTPRLLDRGYQTALPYLSIAQMFDKNLGSMLQGADLPPDLSWLAPMGTWTCVLTPDEEGIQAYSVSGIGNQGILVAGALYETTGILQGMGWLPKPASVPLSNETAPPTAVSTPTSPSAPTNPSGNGPATPSPATTVQNSQSTIYITQDGRIFFDNTLVPFDQFGDFIQSKKASNPGLKLIVRVDRDASSDVLSRVMDAGTTAGFGVLPYTYTTGTDSLPPSAITNTNVTPTPPNTTANMAPPPVTGSSASTNSTPTISSPPHTNLIPDATSPTPAPATTQ